MKLELLGLDVGFKGLRGLAMTNATVLRLGILDRWGRGGSKCGRSMR